MRKLVLFDIDGTILLTAGAGRRAIVAALTEEVGRRAAFDDDPVRRQDRSPDRGRDARGGGAAGAARIGPGPARSADRYVALSRARAGAAHRPHHAHARACTSCSTGSRREHGVVLGLLTGNLAEGAALKLRSGGIDPERFRVGAYGSDAAHRPDLPPIAARRAEAIFGRVPRGAEVVIIGDTPADIACGQASTPARSRWPPARTR